MRIWVYSGKMMDVTNVRPEDIELVDIVRPLSMKCRFGGQVDFFYSIAQHSVLVSLILPRSFAKWGLFHDAGEAYLVDVPTPLHPLVPELKRAESRIMEAVKERFHLPSPMPDLVKVADTRALVAEGNLLQGSPDWLDPFSDVEPIEQEITPLDPSAAEAAFFERFLELTGGS